MLDEGIRSCILSQGPLNGSCKLNLIRQEEWEEELERVGKRLQWAVVELSVKRRAASSRLRASVEGCLGELAMGRSRFDIAVSLRPAKEVRGQANASFFTIKMQQLTMPSDSHGSLSY